MVSRKFVSFSGLLLLLLAIGVATGCASPTPTPVPAATPISAPTNTPLPEPTDVSAPTLTDTPIPTPPPTPESATSTPLPEAQTLPPPGASVVVDNADAGFVVESGEWGTCQNGDCSGACYGFDFRYAEPECSDCRARFDFTVETAGEYDVWTWWPWGEDRATDTPFTFVYSGGPFTINVDQRNSGDDWYWLATLAFEAGESASIVVEGTATGFANADAIALTPLGSAPSGPPAAGEPVVQYYYSEESYTAGCYYLHWDVSEATAVYLNDEAVDNPGSTEVCPEESTVYVLRAENEASSVEQTLTVEVAAAPPPVAPPTPTEQSIAPPTALPPVAGFRRIIFLHHSCGANLIEQGNVRQRFTALGYEFYDHGYNGDGLVLADGTWTGRNFDVPDDNTNPDGFAVIFSQPLHDPPDNTFSYLMQYDVIAFKSCFPVSHIESDEQLAEYKSYYLSIRDRMDQYPNKIFIVVTQPPEIPNDTNATAAARARAFTNWLASDEYLSGHANVFTFNFFDLLADPGNNMLRVEYRVDEYDAHPNELANRTIGPLFVDFIDRAIRAYSGR